MTSNLIINILMSTSLTTLWGSINTLQFILNIPLLGVVLPVNALDLNSALKEIAEFDVIDSDFISDQIFTDAFSEI